MNVNRFMVCMLLGPLAVIVLLFLDEFILNASTFLSAPTTKTKDEETHTTTSNNDSGNGIGNSATTNTTSMKKDEESNITKRTNGSSIGDESFLQLHDLPPGLKLCRIQPTPVPGKPVVRFADLPANSSFHVLQENFYKYQCGGFQYEQFMEQGVYKVVRRKSKQNPFWGQRHTIIPPKPKFNNKVTNMLIMGNSHTGQFARELLCQYRDQIIHAEDLMTEYPGYGNAMRYSLQLPHDEFANSSTKSTSHVYLNITMVINHPCCHSARWKENLEEYLLKHPLEDLDFIILGHFNKFNKYYKDTMLWSGGFRFGVDYPQFQIDIDKYSRGFGWKDLAQVFNVQSPNNHRPSASIQSESNKPKPNKRHSTGPTILYLHCMQEWTDKQYPQIQNDVKQWQKVDTGVDVYAMSSRRIFTQQPELNGTECSAKNNITTVVECINNGLDHKCIGGMGGLPDLIAWEVVEKIWQILA